ncbi:PAS domain-containing sensor histidine kinase [Dyadobacter flavalbus]|uniref:histidine kinase n=1 Tax=Dyadobacter flavalbus TaxID=2579942 RepID=A0A5M8QYX1_9BACT|nr:PAS domain-containing sensor histidine kinase [Dyadobacter flavalbus]KAA6439856.1 PAS domain-containing sensor histidine kinase [Dyadobacter flavalbus]
MGEKTIIIKGDAGFQMLFNCATVGILVIDAIGSINLLNPCAESLFGYNNAELSGQPIELLIPENLRSNYFQSSKNYVSRHIDNPADPGNEIYARKKNGEYFPVDISLSHYELDGEWLAFVFVNDITDQVKTRKFVTEREEWLRNMVDNLPVMVWVTDPERRCTYLNNTWLSFTGNKLEQELGDGWIDGIFPDDLDYCLSVFNTAYSKLQSFSMEYRLRHHDGEYRWINGTGRPTYSSDNVFTGYIGSCTDVHQHRSMTDVLEKLVTIRTNELSVALQNEKEMNDLKTRFVSMASHEFRTPLSIVLSSTLLIEQYARKWEDEKVTRHISKIKSSVSNLTDVLSDFLSLDKLGQNKVELEPAKFNLKELMNQIIEDAQPLRKKGQQIVFNYEGVESIVLDNKKLRYIIANLISNALKYSEENTQILLQSEVRNGLCSFKVQDQGVGIPEDDHIFMFTEFFRAKNASSFQGTGLGLTIVKRYVDLIGGSINFTSKLGEGTCFNVQLPYQEAL